jgi:hypothetical protein
MSKRSLDCLHFQYRYALLAGTIYHIPPSRRR